MTKVQNLPKERVRELIQGCFHDLRARIDVGFIPQTAYGDLEVAEQEEYASSRMRDLKEQLGTGRYDGTVKLLAKTVASEANIKASQLTDAAKHDLLSGAARALMEEQGQFIFRLRERLLPYLPSDPLFADLPAATSNHPVAAPQGHAVGPTVQEIIDHYLAAKTHTWAPKTASSRKSQLSYMAEHLGPETRASKLTAYDLSQLGDAIARMRVGHHTSPAKSFASRQTDDPAKRISPKTALLIFEACKAAFAWARRKGLIAIDPGAGLHLDLATPKAIKGIQKKRRPLNEAEVLKLFQSTVYSGHASPHRRFDAGPVITRDAKFWVPIIGYYTGMRLGEIVQLSLDDVVFAAEHPHLMVTEEGGGEVGSGEHKHVKTQASVRAVPLHPDLIVLGFQAFAEDRQRRRKGKGRLFFDVSYGADNMASTVFSKWFGRWLDHLDLTDPALVFHSFRHGVEDALRDAKQPPYVITRVLGHAEQGMAGIYGEGVSLAVAYDAVAQMKLPRSLVGVVTGSVG